MLEFDFGKIVSPHRPTLVIILTSSPVSAFVCCGAQGAPAMLPFALIFARRAPTISSRGRRPPSSRRTRRSRRPSLKRSTTARIW